MNSDKLRIALYSPGIVGLGHLRRNLLISQALVKSSLQPVSLIIAEAREASAYVNTMPSEMDTVTLPGLSKNVNGECKPRYLNLPFDEMIKLRSNVIRATLEDFEPDVLIVDNLPRGAYRELDPALQYLKSKGGTRCVLGLRDVLDDPDAVQRDWCRWQNELAIREHYEAIWVYGDPSIYNLLLECQFSKDVASKVRYTGYLDQRPRLAPVEDEIVDPFERLEVSDGGLILCLVGGGQDGDRLAQAFIDSELPARTTGVIVAGPFMSLEALRKLTQQAAVRPCFRILRFIPEPGVLFARAKRVIAMGGYNTVCEVLSFAKPALIIPRVRPRREQIIRAQRLRDLDLIDMLHPEALSARALSDWMARDVAAPQVQGRIDLDGLSRLPGLLAELLADSHPALHEGPYYLDAI